MANDYGKNNTVFLLGINESGKSSILDAIHQLEVGFSGSDYYDVCHKSVQDTLEEIYVSAIALLTDEEYMECIELLAENFPVLGDDIKDISKIEIIKSAFIDSENSGTEFEINITFDDNFSFEKYKSIDGVNVDIIGPEEELENSQETMLTPEILEKIISTSIESKFDESFPTITSWKSSPEHLIMDGVNLQEYRENIDISIPLTNIFSLAGKKDLQSIQQTIGWALGADENKATLEEHLSDVSTKHINNIWSEHPIKLKVKIDGASVNILVEDENTEHRAYLKVRQRSDGFKQFISLLLTLSAEYQGEKLKNRVMLLDEPEAHLHPSGVRFMRDEIFKMAHDNQILVATHSPSMVDLMTPQRHWIVKKENMETKLNFVGEKVSMKDEEVLRMAFGIDVMRELFPEKLFLVEGKTDKELLQFALHELNSEKEESIGIPIKSAGGSNMSIFANMVNFDDVRIVILLDADDAGKRMRQKIIETNPSYYNENNVFTLNNIINDLPNNATVEDLIPVSSVEKCLQNNDMAYDFSKIPIGNNLPVLTKIVAVNLGLKGSENKKEMDNIKLKMARQAIEDYSSRNKQEYDRLFKVARVLFEKMCAT